MKIEPMTDEKIADVASSCTANTETAGLRYGEFAHAIIAARDEQWRTLIADREKRAQAAQPHAYAVYFPDQQREELVHDLDELLDDLTNYEHTVTPLFATEPSKPVQAREVIGYISKRGLQALRRGDSPTVHAKKGTFDIPIGVVREDSKPVQAEAPTASNADRAIAQEERACRAEDALVNLVNQIRKCNPIDDHGHLMQMNMAYLKAVELLDASDIDPADRRAALATQQEAQPQAERLAADFTRQLDELSQRNYSLRMENADLRATQQEAQPQAERDITDLIQQRDHREEIIDQLCDAVLGVDRPEWSSAYYFEDAVTAVNERMEWIDQRLENRASNAAQAEPAGGDKEDAERYRWLRHGDNDERVLQHYRTTKLLGATMYLLRNDQLDAAIDAGRAAQQATERQT